MNTKSQISDLRDRVSAASGGDRELDCAIAVAVDGFWYDEGAIYAAPGYRRDEDGGVRLDAPDMLVPRYTSSTDAALALIERVKPADDLILSKHVSVKEIFWEAELGDQPAVEAPTPALALISALLQAVEGEGE